MLQAAFRCITVRLSPAGHHQEPAAAVGVAARQSQRCSRATVPPDETALPRKQSARPCSLWQRPREEFSLDERAEHRSASSAGSQKTWPMAEARGMKLQRAGCAGHCRCAATLCPPRRRPAVSPVVCATVDSQAVRGPYLLLTGHGAAIHGPQASEQRLHSWPPPLRLRARLH